MSNGDPSKDPWQDTKQAGRAVRHATLSIFESKTTTILLFLILYGAVAFIRDLVRWVQYWF